VSRLIHVHVGIRLIRRVPRLILLNQLFHI
jgi:hypothetical protein